MEQSSTDVCCSRKAPLATSPSPSWQQLDDPLEVVETNNSDVVPAFDISVFYTTAHKPVIIWVSIEQVRDLQHHHFDTDPARAAEQEASSSYHCSAYSPEMISVTAVQSVVELVDTSDGLNCTEEREMVLHKDCHVRVVEGCHRLHVLRYLQQSSKMALQLMSDQIEVNNKMLIKTSPIRDFSYFNSFGF